MKTGRIFSALALSVAAACLAGSLGAQDAGTRVAESSDWQVFEGTDPKACWAVTAPKKTVNTRGGREVTVRRGDILLFVTYQPARDVAGEVSFTGGYPFAKGSTATLEIDGATFELFTDGEYAWPATPAEDRKIVTAMKRGADAVVTARSTRGTQTKDTFSLIGATAMIEDAEKRCGS
ncbi:MAG: hypothetical protein F4213_03690 [Boseongicola sp. SB0677_bin_26]|nr:hypothetical protein [Boseongicola sp. SB0665_bin_10]MYG25112.1 hypothetical protein [Boseongicola sp. SB0677_bin_26]